MVGIPVFSGRTEFSVTTGNDPGLVPFGGGSGEGIPAGAVGGSRFGQLSYDKGMVILSASQPSQTAQGEWVTGGEGRTLLVDALGTVAKEYPQQNLAQWLHGVEEQLPRTVKQLYPALKEEDAQLPVLLDFSRYKFQHDDKTGNSND